MVNPSLSLLGQRDRSVRRCEAYCTIFEREFTLLSAAQKLGDAAYAEAVEHLWFNAGQGSRVPDGTAILYLSTENRLSVNDELQRSQRFSPTHQQVAVCCNPNSTRVASYFAAAMWMRPRSAEPAVAVMLYGPSRMTADIGGTAVSVEEKTLYPYSGDVDLVVSPAKPVAFCLWLRKRPSAASDFSRGRRQEGIATIRQASHPSGGPMWAKSCKTIGQVA